MKTAITTVPRQPLCGGTANQGRVVRVGDTVCRPLAPCWRATHALLDHLALVGFGGAPRVLEAGPAIEKLTYIEGQAAVSPLPEEMLTDHALASVADLLSRYHRAAASFDPAGHCWPRPVPARYRTGLVSHNDVHPANLVFRDGQAVALIDFDLAGPGSAAWDFAAAARSFVPLLDDADVPDSRQGRALERFRILLAASSLTRADRCLVAEAVVANHDWTYAIVTEAAAAGHAGFADHWRAVAPTAARARYWCKRHRRALIASAAGALNTYNEGMRTKRGLAVIVALAGFVIASGFAPGRSWAQAPPHQPPQIMMDATMRACGGLPSFSKATADEIMAGKLTISPFPAVTIDPDRGGDINWHQNPFNHPTWQQDFQSGSWIEMLISGYLAGGSEASAYQARAAALIKGWLAGVPIGSRDPQVLICLSEGFPGQAWISSQIDASVNWLADHWQGAWNHGLVQDIKLMRIGCAYPATAFGGDALKWRQTADNQMLESFQPNRLGPSIDADGVVNEQATGYEKFVWDLWQVGAPEVAACGYPLPASISARIAKMPAFLTEATQPNGDLVQIGDTYVEQPPSLPRPTDAPLVAVYSAGYVFGRSKWGPNGTFYSLRFGPGRQVHGHDDHMGITYYARGRNLIVNAGHTGYEVSPYRTYIQSPEAASTLVAPGQHFRASAPTTLLAHSITAGSQYFQVGDYAFGGRRTRSGYVHRGPDFMLVLDRDAGAHTYQQLWHLDPGLTVTRVTANAAVASAPGTTLTIARIALPGQVIPARSTTVVTGQTNPYQGWVSHQALQRIPAPVVVMTGHGAGAALSSTMLTLIVATAPGTRVTTRVASSTAPAGRYVVDITIGTTTTPVTVNLSTGAIG